MSIKPDLIFVTDIHLRGDVPLCRTDENFAEVQFDKILWLDYLRSHYQVPILIAGDLGHRSSWPGWLISRVIPILRDKQYPTYVIAGQHDLPGHLISNIEKSALWVLYEAGSIEFIPTNPININGCRVAGFPWKVSLRNNAVDVLVTHMTVSNVAEKYETTSALRLLKTYNRARTILTGDVHKTFTVSYKGRHLINPGTLCRQKTTEADHRPCVFLYYRESNSFKQVYFQVDKHAISREHVEAEELKEMRFLEYVEGVKNLRMSLDFKNNLKTYKKKNPKLVSEGAWNKIERAQSDEQQAD